MKSPLPSHERDIIDLATRVEKDQKYAILAFDRDSDIYCFIAKDQINVLTYTNTHQKHYKNHPRYACEKAYVFPESVEYFKYSSKDKLAAMKWAAEQCIEMRILPEWWKPEKHDLSIITSIDDAIKRRRRCFDNTIDQNIESKYEDEYKYRI